MSILYARSYWVNGALLDFSLLALHILCRIEGNTGDERIEGFCLQLTVFRGCVQGQDLNAWQEFAEALLASLGMTDALCAILDDRRFVPGLLADRCLKCYRSRQKDTPSRFVPIFYFLRKNKNKQTKKEE